jgi:pimeloyl-ACP methyl ester carboxylesterase
LRISEVGIDRSSGRALSRTSRHSVWAAAGIDRPTLIVQGDKDASAPLALTGARTAGLIKSSKLNVDERAPHVLR